jgi:hypothetical protein
MSWTPADRPGWVRATNAAWRGLERVGLPPGSLDPDALLATASRRTGLRDFGDDRFREPFALFVESLGSASSRRSPPSGSSDPSS